MLGQPQGCDVGQAEQNHTCSCNHHKTQHAKHERSSSRLAHVEQHSTQIAGVFVPSHIYLPITQYPSPHAIAENKILCAEDTSKQINKQRAGALVKKDRAVQFKGGKRGETHAQTPPHWRTHRRTTTSARFRIGALSCIFMLGALGSIFSGCGMVVVVGSNQSAEEPALSQQTNRSTSHRHADVPSQPAPHPQDRDGDEMENGCRGKHGKGKARQFPVRTYVRTYIVAPALFRVSVVATK